jgi:hypothetical protein
MVRLADQHERIGRISAEGWAAFGGRRRCVNREVARAVYEYHLPVSELLMLGVETTFLAGKQVSPTYSLTFETAVDMVHSGSGWGDAVDNLIEDAISDITSGRLDDLAEALAAK